MGTQIVTEGETKILLLSTQAESSSTPVFYNPHMRLNRDINVAAVAAFTEGEDFSFADALSASGIRGIRIAREVGGNVTLCDWNLKAIDLIKKNIALNGLSNCSCVHADANVLLSQQRFDIVDLDPFGTPMPFLDAAGRSVKKLLAVTATDTAPLCGAHLKSAIRTYSAHPQNNEYHRETGLRVLLGAIVRCLAKYDKAAMPVLSYAHRHYARVYVRIEKSVKSADAVMKQIGYMAHCSACNNRYPVYGLAPAVERCSNCDSRITLSGPLWLGVLHERGFAEKVKDVAEKKGFSEGVRLLQLCAEELELPMYYDYHNICHRLHVSAPSITKVLWVLRERGYKATRTHLCGTGIKTDASAEEVEEAVLWAQRV
jgi:tRNA (guanine26-N2/guanine27-N2)-dimethyltransferase